MSMKVRFLGVGSAFDENHTNTSMILFANGTKLLLDCGYSVPPALWKYNNDPEFIDAIWISHLHGDHFLGLGPLITRWKTDGRKKPAYILTATGNGEIIKETIENSYRGTLRKLPFEFKIIEFERKKDFGGMNLRIAPTIHPAPNHALRIEYKDKVFCYSGDGMHTPESRDLFSDTDLLVHETFTLDEETDGHADMKSVVYLKSELKINKIACVHVFREKRNGQNIKDFLENLENVYLPEDGDELDI